MKLELDNAKVRIEEMKEDIVKAERLYQAQRLAMLAEMEEERTYLQQSADEMTAKVESQAAELAELQAAKAEDSALAEERIAGKLRQSVMICPCSILLTFECGADLEASIAADAEAAGVAEAECALSERRIEALTKELEGLRSKHSSVETRLTGLQSTHQELSAAHEDKEAEAEEHRAAYHATREAVGTAFLFLLKLRPAESTAMGVLMCGTGVRSDLHKRKQSAERKAFTTKIEALKKALKREHARAKQAVKTGEQNKAKAKIEVARLQKQLQMLMDRIRLSEKRVHAWRLHVDSSPAYPEDSAALPSSLGVSHPDDSGGFSESEPEPVGGSS